MIRVRQVDTIDKFESLGLIWNDLLQKSKDNDIFSTWEWLSCWWKHFGKRGELRVLVAEENGKIMAIAPLMLSKYNFMNFGSIATIDFVGSPQSDCNNFIWLEEEEQCLKLFVEHLARQGDWNSLRLSNVREGTLSEGLLRQPRADYALKLEDSTKSMCPYVELPTSMEEFMTKLGRDVRHQARRKMRRLKEQYQVGLKAHSEFNSIQEAMERLFDLHERRWSSKREPGDFASAAVREFHLDVAKRLAEKGWLALSFLSVDGEAVAADYCFDYRQKRYGYQSGFDPGFAAYSVGTLLRLRNIETCIAKGLREFDFGRGGEPYKLRWATQVRKNFQIQSVGKGFFARLRRQVTKNKTVLTFVEKLGRSLILKP